MAVVKQIMNRRQAIVIDNIDPEILTEGILTEEKLSEDGFVKNTDYASATVGGVIKANPNTYGVRVAAEGMLYGAPFTLAAYKTGSNNLFITKGTLETVILDVIERMLQGIANDGGDYDTAETGTEWTFLLRKAEGGPSLEAVTMTPPTPPTP